MFHGKITKSRGTISYMCVCYYLRVTGYENEIYYIINFIRFIKADFSLFLLCQTTQPLSVEVPALPGGIN